jgi:hypothetical protein
MSPDNMCLDEYGIAEKKEGYFWPKKKAKIGGVTLMVGIIIIIIFTRYVSKNSSTCNDNQLNKTINLNDECSSLYCKNPNSKLSGNKLNSF